MIQKTSHNYTQPQSVLLNDIRDGVLRSPEVRPQVVDDVSRRISSGSYYIQIDRIVEKLLSHNVGDRI